MARRIALLAVSAVVAAQVGVYAAGSASAATVPSPQSSDCAQVTIGNGGFEAPVIPNNSFVIFGDASQPGQSAVTWLTTATDHQVEFWSTGFNGVPAPQGNQFAELNANQVATLYQTLNTSALPAGAKIYWSLKHRGRSGTDVMRVNIGPSVGAPNYTSPDLSDSNTAWGSHSGTYVLPAGQPSTRFSFVSVSSVGGASIGNFLDDVVFATDACVTLHKTVAPTTLRVGDVATYTVVAKNEGGADATGLALSDAIPAGTTYVPGSLTVDGVSQPDPAGTPLTIPLGTLPDTTRVPSRTVVFQVLVGAGAALSDVNEARASYVDSGTGLAEASVSDNATFSVGPRAVDDVASTGQGLAVDVPILGNDLALTVDPLDATSVALVAPAGGTQVSATEVSYPGEGDYSYSAATGLVTFIPDPGFSGTVAHPPTYTVQSAGGTVSNQASITPTVSARPVAGDDSTTVDAGTVVTIPLLGNDSAATGRTLDPASVRLVVPAGAPAGSAASPDGKTLTVPGQGVYTVSGAGVLTFTPGGGFTGDPAVIDYTVADDTGSVSAAATVTIIARPVAVDDFATTVQGQPVTVAVLANDTVGGAPLDPTSVELQLPAAPPPGSTLSPDAKTLTVPGVGVWTVTAGGSVTFTPEPTFSGVAPAVPYSVADTDGNRSTAAASLTVTVGLVTPIARPDTGTVPSGGSTVSVPLLFNDSPGDLAVPLVPGSVTLQLPIGAPVGTVLSPDGKLLVVAGQGSYAVGTDGSVVFTAAAGFIGSALPVPYTVLDANGTAASSTLTVTVLAPVVVTGTVIDASTGHPIPGAKVTITDKDGHTYTTTAGPDGSFTFTGSPSAPITPGAVVVVASKSGFSTSTVTVVVVVGTPQVLVLSLLPRSMAAGGLPDTGNDASGPLAVGLLLVVGGVALVLGGRRRRRS